MIVCYQYARYTPALYGVIVDNPKYVFYKPDILHNGTLIMNGISVEDPICGWKIKTNEIE